MKSIGHENIKNKLKNVISSGSIGHAYLFTGKDGIGKRIVATEFAKSILCASPNNGEACGICEACLTFDNNSEFKVITPEKDVIKVDMIRGFESEIYLKPTMSERKVFIIDNADSMNEQAQNALLKVLEEPPTYATIILITSNKEKIIQTIKSRVIEMKFDKLTNEEIEEILKQKKLEYTKDSIDFANGSVKKAVEFLEDENFEISKEVARLLENGDFLLVNRKFEEIKADKILKPKLATILEKVLYIYHCKLKKDINFNIKLIDCVEQAIQKLKRNANVDLVLDILMIDICKI